MLEIWIDLSHEDDTQLREICEAEDISEPEWINTLIEAELRRRRDIVHSVDSEKIQDGGAAMEHLRNIIKAHRVAIVNGGSSGAWKRHVESEILAAIKFCRTQEDQGDASPAL